MLQRKSFHYELHVGDGDLGKIIGNRGYALRSIRTILGGVAAKEHKRGTLEVLE